MRLAAAVALVGLVGLVAGCGGGSGKARTLPTVAPSATTTAAGSASPTTAAGVTATTWAGTTRATSPGARTGGAGTGGTSSGPSAALAPAPPGTYTYATAGSSNFGLSTLPYPSLSTLTVDPPTGTRQHSTRNLRDASGNGPVTQLELDYRDTGIFVDQLGLSVSVSGFTNSLDLRPPSPALLLPTGAGPGTHAAFDLSGDGSTAHLVADVVRRETVDIGGRAVDTLVVHIVTTLPSGDTTGSVDLTAWMAPSVRIWVKEHFVADASGSNGLYRFHSQYDATLTRLP